MLPSWTFKTPYVTISLHFLSIKTPLLPCAPVLFQLIPACVSVSAFSSAVAGNYLSTIAPPQHFQPLNTLLLNSEIVYIPPQRMDPFSPAWQPKQTQEQCKAQKRELSKHAKTAAAHAATSQSTRHARILGSESGKFLGQEPSSHPTQHSNSTEEFLRCCTAERWVWAVLSI